MKQNKESRVDMYFTQLSVDDFDAFVTNHFSHYTQDAVTTIIEINIKMMSI